MIQLLLVVCAISFSACNLTKFVPEGEYLLNKANVKVEDTKDVAAAELRNYLQQKQNTEILGFWKLQFQRHQLRHHNLLFPYK
mgnify:CR=1 FL=1